MVRERGMIRLGYSERVRARARVRVPVVGKTRHVCVMSLVSKVNGG